MTDEREHPESRMDTVALKRRVLAIVRMTALLAAASSPMVAGDEATGRRTSVDGP